jgi:hypothetical protein
MPQSSDNTFKDSNPENALKKFLEKSKTKTEALKKLLKFIEDKEIGKNKPIIQNQDRN